MEMQEYILKERVFGMERVKSFTRLKYKVLLKNLELIGWKGGILKMKVCFL
jgi:hypothetical protein